MSTSCLIKCRRVVSRSVDELSRKKCRRIVLDLLTSCLDSRTWYCNFSLALSVNKNSQKLQARVAGLNIPGQNIPCHFLTPQTKHPTKICPGQNIPCCFCHPGHNIPCCFWHPGQNTPCHFYHPGQNIPHSDCSFRVSLI